MFESFVGSFLGVWTILALLWAKDRVSVHFAEARMERNAMKRLREQMAGDTRNSSI